MRQRICEIVPDPFSDGSGVQEQQKVEPMTPELRQFIRELAEQALHRRAEEERQQYINEVVAAYEQGRPQPVWKSEIAEQYDQLYGGGLSPEEKERIIQEAEDLAAQGRIGDWGFAAW